MYIKEQEEADLKEYERLGTVTVAIRRLGYPSKSTFYLWYECRKVGLENRHGYIAAVCENTSHVCNALDYLRHSSAEFKEEVLHCCFEL